MVRGGIMNQKLLASLATAGLLAGGGSAAAVAAAAAPPAAASTVAVASSTSKAPECGPLGPLVAKGTITRAQAMDIHKAFISYVHNHWRMVVDTVVGQEVKNHTLTQAQANAVTSAITQWVQKHRGEQAGHHGTCHYVHGGGMMSGSPSP